MHHRKLDKLFGCMCYCEWEESVHQVAEKMAAALGSEWKTMAESKTNAYDFISSLNTSAVRKKFEMALGFGQSHLHTSLRVIDSPIPGFKL